jgi:uncharacterized damage-inducible protein DinB
MKQFKHLIIAAVVLLLAGSAGLFAGEPAGSTFAKEFLPIWQNAKAYSVEMAELMPEDQYGFKPVPEIMSFGEQVVHMASATYFFVSKLTGEENPGKGFKAEGKTKAEIIKYLKDSFDYGEKVLSNFSDADASKMFTLWEGEKRLGAWAFLLARDHITHHRGSMVIYLRLKGIKPAEYRG